MADPKGMTEIEDVLSSIRRLVAAETRKTGEAAAPPPPVEEALILTPAQRVDEAPDEDTAEDTGFDTLRDWDADTRAELTAASDTASLEETLAELEAALDGDLEEDADATLSDADADGAGWDEEVAPVADLVGEDAVAATADWEPEEAPPLFVPDAEAIEETEISLAADASEAWPETGETTADTDEAELLVEPLVELDAEVELPGADMDFGLDETGDVDAETHFGDDENAQPVAEDASLEFADLSDAGEDDGASDPSVEHLFASAPPADDEELAPAVDLTAEAAPLDGASGTGLDADKGFLLTEPTGPAEAEAGREPRRGFIWVGGFDDQAAPEPVAELSPDDPPRAAAEITPYELRADGEAETGWVGAEEMDGEEAEGDEATPGPAFGTLGLSDHAEADIALGDEPAAEPEPAWDEPPAEADLPLSPMDAFEPGPDEAPVEPEADARPVDTEADAEDDDLPVPGLFDVAEDLPLDEAALREIVAEIIRDELRGALGERLGRNLRKLVRAEIQAALAARDDLPRG